MFFYISIFLISLMTILGYYICNNLHKINEIDLESISFGLIISAIVDFCLSLNFNSACFYLGIILGLIVFLIILKTNYHACLFIGMFNNINQGIFLSTVFVLNKYMTSKLSFLITIAIDNFIEGISLSFLLKKINHNKNRYFIMITIIEPIFALLFYFIFNAIHYFVCIFLGFSLCVLSSLTLKEEYSKNKHDLFYCGIFIYVIIKNLIKLFE